MENIINSQEAFLQSINTVANALQSIASIKEAKKNAANDIRNAKHAAFSTVQQLIAFAISKNNDTPLQVIAEHLGGFAEFQEFLRPFKEVISYSAKDKAFKRSFYAKKHAELAAQDVSSQASPFTPEAEETAKAEKKAQKQLAPVSEKLKPFLAALKAAEKKANDINSEALDAILSDLRASISATEQKIEALAKQESEAAQTEAKELPSLESMFAHTTDAPVNKPKAKSKDVA